MLSGGWDGIGAGWGGIGRNGGRAHDKDDQGEDEKGSIVAAVM